MAGDLLPGSTVEQRVATGFHRNTMTNREDGVNREEFRIEQVIDRASTVGTAWLGLTLGCARCHDHKYDPISQKEFYQLCAFFDQATEVNIEAPLPGEVGPYLQGKPEHDRKRKELFTEYRVAELQTAWEKKILEAADNLNAELVWALAWRRVGLSFDGGQDILRLDPSERTQKQKDRLTDYFIGAYGRVVGQDRYKQVKFEELREKLRKLADQYAQLSEAQTLTKNPAPPKTRILIRGEFREPGIEVEAGTPAVLPPLSPGVKPSRLTFARWLISKDNPLTARVTVNRMWQEFFGQGLVASSDNFGTRGDLPSHPELLDWLAAEFMENGWNVKEMHRLMVMSATYRQSAKGNEITRKHDPGNKLLARQSRLRLQAELIRDATLSVSGLLQTAVGGRSVQPPSPPVEEDQQGVYIWKESEGQDRYRRGLYILFRRAGPYPQLITFDAPDGQQSCSQRARSTTPLQALNLLNDPVFLEAAQGLAVRVLREKAGSVNERVQYAFRVCLSREPSQRETDALVRYYRRQHEIFEREPNSREALFPAKSLDGVDPAEAAVWTAVSSLLLNLDEFITRE